jgi:hypothetical protein
LRAIGARRSPHRAQARSYIVSGEAFPARENTTSIDRHGD